MDALIHALHVATLPFRILRRPLDIVEPCVGMGSFRELCFIAGTPYGSPRSLAADTDGRLEPFYDTLDAHDPDVKIDHVAIGDRGNVLEIPLPKVPLAEGVLTGPPCQHLGSSGLRLGELDKRTEVFDTIINWVTYLAWRGCLVFFVIENSDNIDRMMTSSNRTYAEVMVDRLCVGIPFFQIEADTLTTRPILPITRRRWWCRGLRDARC